MVHASWTTVLPASPCGDSAVHCIYVALVAVALAVGLLVVGNKSTAHRRPAGRPNILIIVTRRPEHRHHVQSR